MILSRQIQNQLIAMDLFEHSSTTYRLYLSIYILYFFFSMNRCFKNERKLKTFEIYKFADVWDILLMIVGSLAGRY
jgi:hypothetical protein